MKQINKTSSILFFILFFTTINTRGMENEPPHLFPEIHKKIITTILDLCLHDLENTIEDFNKTMEENNLCSYFLYGRNGKKILNKILYWIGSTPFSELQGPDFDRTSNKGNTILHHATEASLEFNGSRDMFNLTRYLLKHNASPNIPNNDGKTAFFICMRSFECSYDRMDISNTQTNVLNLFLDTKANPNVSSQDNLFMFILASSAYYEPIARIIERTDVTTFMNSKNELGATLACAAAEWGNIEFLRILAKEGADFNIKDAEGLTPLDHALTYRQDTKKCYATQNTEDLINLLTNVAEINNQFQY